ncbi:protein kinase domain-containing protein [Metarhizium guizhouense ARSEF 977]|uniref:non-specific serine/threonine protein kinase n=1 Tax=Metarhizium guizhouense (strain ARSEF 977) TaxID=1276136 RepID=A0A0B4GR86_METGA|nr:protein kinase domain-containing protein [Metarhizium guizhouense ARSEF 977]
MKSFKTLTHSWQTPRAIHPPKSSQIALPSRTRRHSLHSCAIRPGQGLAQAYRDQYHWIDGAESLEKYTRGGYHPVMIGDVLNKRYQIVDKLGHGGYSTVWLARDTQQELYVALKVGISDSRLHETAILKGSPTSSLAPRQILSLHQDTMLFPGSSMNSPSAAPTERTRVTQLLQPNVLSAMLPVILCSG